MNPLGRVRHFMLESVIKKVPRRALKTGSLALADQSVISVANFATMIAAARVLGPAAFGVFALLYTLLGVVDSLQTSFITSPHTVISASRKGFEYQRYTSSVALMQLVLAFGSGLLFVVAAIVTHWLSNSVSSMLLALAFASTTYQLQGFTRKVLYTESRFPAALLDDSLIHGLRIALLGLLLITVGVTGERLFLVLGASCGAGAVLGFWQIRHSLTLAFDRGVLREHWHFGNWLSASEIFSELPRYVTAAILSATLSVGAYGAYRAGSQLVNAANIPMKSLTNVLRPRLARDAQHGPRAVMQTMLPIMVLGAISFSIFGVALIILREPLFRLVYGPEFAPYAAAIFLVALEPIVDLQKRVLTSGILAFRRTRTIFTRSVIGSVVGTSTGGVAILLFGLPAAGAIGFMRTTASLFWLALVWRKQIQGEEQWTQEPSSIATAPTDIR